MTSENGGDSLTDDGLAENRTREVVSGSRWGAVTQLAVFTSRWIVSAILARYLLPSEYGVVILGLTFVTFLDVFKDMGTVPAIVQRKTVDRELLSTLFWVNIFLGAVLSGLFALTLPLLRPDQRGLLSALGLLLFISSFGMVQQAIIRRNMRFKSLALYQVSQTLVNGVVSVVCAVMGYGAWSLVIGQLAGTVVSTTISWTQTTFRPHFYFSRARLSEVMGYSGNMTAFQFFNWGFMNGDKVIVGQMLGDSALGLYGFGQRVLYMPVRSVTSAVQTILFSTFSRVQDDNRVIARGYLRSCAAIIALTAPVMLGFVAVAHPFVEVVYGKRWLDAAPVASILAPIGLLHSLHFTVGSVYKAKGRADWLFRWGVVSGIITIASYFAGVPWGINGVAATYAIAMVLISYHTFAIPFRLIDLRVRDLVAVVAPYVVCASIMGAAAFGVRRLMEEAGYGPAHTLLASVSIGGVIYVGWMLLAKPPAYADLKRMVTRQSRVEVEGSDDDRTPASTTAD